MTTESMKKQVAVLENLESLQREGEALKKAFQNHRDDLRAEAISAVTECDVSIARASAAAGIDRRTLTHWLQVHNAEKKGRQSAKR